MSRGSVLAAARRAAGRSMRDTCTITRSTTATTDTATGIVTRTPETVYEGRCRVQRTPVGGDGSEDQVAAADVLMLSTQLHLPVSTSLDVRAGDVVTVTAAVNDLDLIGRVYTVTGEAAKSEASARRLFLQEVTG